MATVALVAGCASGPETLPSASPKLPAPGVNLAGYPPAFRAGYADGCASVDGAKKRDEPRFKSDSSYAQGWRDGFDICKKRR